MRFQKVHFPDMYLVRQSFPDRRLPDVEASVHETMEAFFQEGFRSGRLRSGSQIAIAVGSRGITNNALIVKSVVDSWKCHGFNPFIFPAMGSHGGATSEGQKEELARRGITESEVGCPIKSSMELVTLGETPEGIPTYMDRNAYESDGIFLINRIKWHTDFEGLIESGLFKMIAIGLGKDVGAIACHKRAFLREGLGPVIRSVGRQLLSTNKILGGLAILEDAYNQTAKVVALEAHGLEQREEGLLATTKSWKANIPSELDILIVDEIGKNLSGPGMDTKVINRNTVTGLRNPYKYVPWIGQIFARGLHPLSGGNAMGMGLVDVVHDRLLEAMEVERTRKNALTAQAPAAVRQSLFHYPTDLQCLECIFEMIACDDPAKARVGWIQNTKRLDLLALSANLLPVIQENRNLEIVHNEPARPLVFDGDGQLAWNPFVS